MNVNGEGMPFSQSTYGFAIVCGITLLVCLIVAFFLKKRKML